MSLCIALNNPRSKFAIIAGDGRVTKNDELVRDNHVKVTALTQYVSMFCSGAQDYCEILRIKVSERVKYDTRIDEISVIIEEVLKEVLEQFEKENPMYLSDKPEFCPLSTVIGYYDVFKNETGTIEYCHKNKTRRTTEAVVTARGEDREAVLTFFLNNQVDQNDIIDTVFDLFKYINSFNKDVGGDTILHVVTPNGIYEYSRGFYHVSR
ncbi:hypothetical protein [Paenibacillus sp. FSL R7-0272]|uniref:hypothetical protein n=1 Tax=Paenibacillus sp. FSL R7-0272 TaxID=2921679 RepID=UPI0030EBA62F